MKTGKIYFVARQDGLLKIGYTNNLARRFRTLTKSHGILDVVRVINGDRRREKRIHNQFEAAREFGEWFRSSPDMLAKIAEFDDGSIVEITVDDAKKAWLAGEAEMAAEAWELARTIVHTSRTRHGCTYGEALRLVSAEHGIGLWLLTELNKRTTQVVSAFAMKRLKEIHVAELLSLRDTLLAEVEAVENGGVPSALQVRLAAAKGNPSQAAKVGNPEGAGR